jgi:hypothetical protein
MGFDDCAAFQRRRAGSGPLFRCRGYWRPLPSLSTQAQPPSHETQVGREIAIRRFSDAVATSREGHHQRGSRSAFYSYTNRNRELDIKLVEIGIGILHADPSKETQTQGAREWAIKVIEKFSGEHFSIEAKNELLNHKLGFNTGWYDTGYGYTPSPIPNASPQSK